MYSMLIELKTIVVTKDVTFIILFVMHTSATLMMRFWCICLWCPISNWLRLTGENINSRNFSFMYMPTLVRRGTIFLFRPFSKFYNVWIVGNF